MGRIWMEGEGMLYSRTRLSKSEETESWWVFTWPEERVYGEEYENSLERHVRALS